MGEFISLLIGVLTSGGLATIVTASITSKRNKALTEGEARTAYTKEIESIVAGLNLQIDQLQEDIGYLRTEIDQLRTDLGTERAFSEDLIKGYEEGRYPPAPSRYQMK